MRIVLFTATIAVLALVLTGWSETRSANARGFVSVSNQSPAVIAGWDFQNDDGSSTFVSVFAGKEKIGHPGLSPLPVFIDISQTWPAGDPEDPFDDVFRSIWANPDLEPGRLEVSLNDPVSAHLALTAPAMDCTFVPASGLEPVCSETELSVDLDWAASSDPERRHFRDHFELSHGCKINGHAMINVSPAHVSGSITAGGIDQTRGESATFGGVYEKYLSQSVLIAHTIEDCFEIPALGAG